MKIFRMNDCDWWLANSLPEAIESMRQTYGGDFVADEQLSEPRECTDEEMDRLKYCDDGAFYGAEGTQERWQCPLCKINPVLTKQWRWDGEKWQHFHEKPAWNVVGWITCENTMVRTFREELQRTKDDGIARLFATSEI